MVRARKSAVLAAVAAAFLPLAVQAHAHEGLGYHVSNEERAMNAPYFEDLKKRFGEAPARVAAPGSHNHQKRQNTMTTTTRSSSASAASSSHASSGGVVSNASGALSSPVAGGALSMGTIPIAISTTIQATSPLPSTYTAGASAPISGASALPSAVIVPSEWPSLDLVPDINSPQVQAWIAAIDFSKVPNIPITQLGGCSNASNAAAVQNASANGWWTCGGHTRSTDVVDCPQKNTWGMSYDDGPSPDTPRLLQYMVQNNLKSTFFVVGSRVISRPEMLQYEYMAGHQISVHTWSHPYLTTKTNEEIVAELGWTKQAIKHVLGVTPNTFRPPYGDMDDRVRAIALQMGLTPIIWTTFNGQNFDTYDWQIAGGVVNADNVLQRFEAIINQSSQMTTGYIVLAHDLYQQSTSLAIDYVLPYALSRQGLNIEPIYQCLGQKLSDAYVETSSNTSSSTPSGVVTSLDRGSQAQTTGRGINNNAAATGSKTGAASSVAIPVFTILLAGAAACLL